MASSGISAVFDARGKPAIVQKPSPHQAVAIPHAVLLAPSVGQTLATPVQHIFLGGGGWALNLHPIITIWGVPPDCLPLLRIIIYLTFLDLSVYLTLLHLTCGTLLM